jgi:hypothetical protein
MLLGGKGFAQQLDLLEFIVHIASSNTGDHWYVLLVTQLAQWSVGCLLNI